MIDPAGAATTGLLRGNAFVKDNRLLPDGFDKRSADNDIAVRGQAAADETFAGGGDRVRYTVSVAGATGSFRVEAELRYQPIAFRWARNLASYDTPRPAASSRITTRWPPALRWFWRRTLPP